MSKTVIVANTKHQADHIAKMHDLRPWQWRYAFGYHSLQGISPDTQVLVAANYTETPTHVLLDGIPYLRYQMHEQLQVHQMLGGEVAWVAT